METERIPIVFDFSDIFENVGRENDTRTLVNKLRLTRKTDVKNIQVLISETERQRLEEIYSILQSREVEKSSDVIETKIEQHDLSRMLEEEIEAILLNTALEPLYDFNNEFHISRGFIIEPGKLPYSRTRIVQGPEITSNRQNFLLGTQITAASCMEKLDINAVEQKASKDLRALILSNYASLLERLQHINHSSSSMDITPPNLDLMFHEGQLLRHPAKSYPRTYKSYVYGYLNDGDWNRTEEWFEMSINLFDLLVSIYLMPAVFSEQISQYYSIERKLPEVDTCSAWLDQTEESLRYNEFIVYYLAQDAKDFLVYVHTDFVPRILRLYLGMKNPSPDIVSLARQAFLRAVENYHPIRKYQFRLWARLAILKAIHERRE